jgi:YVTN family beta-propeller protein
VAYHGSTKTQTDVEFRILGELEVRQDHRPLPLGGAKQRALLAFLLLNANRVVSRDRLVDELWGESPPPTVNSVLHVYVSRLRKLLGGANGDGLLITQAPGYALRISPDVLDACRFEQLVEEGRRMLAGNDPERAADVLHEALALWRGPALADLAAEPFARAEIGRLEELRLTALEERIDADLALGRHRALVGELEALVATQPYRERLREQLMLALYRSGRQAEALAQYQNARRALVNDLGIEPGRGLDELERAILHHDPSLDKAGVGGRAVIEAPAPSRLIRGRSFIALAAVVLATAAAAGLWALRGSGESASPPINPVGDSVVVIDPETNKIVDEIRLGAAPAAVAIGNGSVWAGDRVDNTLLRIDPKKRKVVRTIGLGVAPSAIAVGARAVWVASDTANVVVRVDPGGNDVVATIPLDPKRFLCCPLDIEVGEGAVWVSHYGRVSRIDPVTNTVVEERVAQTMNIAFGDGALWMKGRSTTDDVAELHRKTLLVVRTIRLQDVGFTADRAVLAAGEDSLWVGLQDNKAVWRIDPRVGRLTDAIPLGRRAYGIAVGEEGVWVAGGDGTVTRIDPTTRKLAKTIPLGVYPVFSWGALAVGEGAVWVATAR